MTRQIVLEKPVSGSRRQPLLGEKITPMATAVKEDRRGVGEVAGGTAAECAAICCCCPCAVMDLLLLAVYKVPTGLCKKAWRKQQRQRMKKKKAAALLQQLPQQQERPLEATSSSSKGGTGSSFDDSEVGRSDGDDDRDGSAADFETEMLDRFYGGGFWRMAQLDWWVLLPVDDSENEKDFAGNG
ncbi:hypothetical protein RHGRI_002121 [Rhododendron griersonianum]|uniref:Uncharacterized protein n=1 Tax=Rhododendron griersonianum TaxID=479676 RepID=A0AAV6LMM2_9ERIC|nr:hypothetical protein RHGRI_002121 [Rhododendron griersonianum]